jgi:hypothetical protein
LIPTRLLQSKQPQPDAEGGAMPQPPLALSDSQIASIMALARPLQPAQRSAFLELIAASLRGRAGQIGDGELHRIVLAIIRDHSLFDPPSDERAGWDISQRDHRSKLTQAPSIEEESPSRTRQRVSG